MKLSKALKEKKRLAAEIADLKRTIGSKNSYGEGVKEKTEENYIVPELYDELLGKIEDLVNLKLMINNANLDIQPLLYKLGEYRSMISFLNGLDSFEGTRRIGYGESTEEQYFAQFSEPEIDRMKKDYQKKADMLQDEIDTYNYTTEIPWMDSEEEKEEKPL